MNIYQRIVLLCGAIALVAVLLTAPMIYTHGTLKYSPVDELRDRIGLRRKEFKYALRIDTDTLYPRMLAVGGSTFLRFFALRNIRKEGDGTGNDSVRGA